MLAVKMEYELVLPLHIGLLEKLPSEKSSEADNEEKTSSLYSLACATAFHLALKLEEVILSAAIATGAVIAEVVKLLKSSHKELLFYLRKIKSLHLKDLVE